VSNPQLRAIVFDFDLTLCDSSQGFIACHCFAAERFGLTPPSPEAIAASIGTPLDLVFPRFYGAEHAGLAEAYIRAYQEHADEVMTGLTVMLDGAAEAVRSLRAAGYDLGIVSQKLRYRVEDVLRCESLLDCFGVVLGGDDIPAFKPDPRGIQTAIQRLGATAAGAIYVGDTLIDAEAAHRAGVRFIAVLTGVTSTEQFVPLQPGAILASVAELPNYLASSS
jgi:phosphoglycolate phosphatase